MANLASQMGSISKQHMLKLREVSRYPLRELSIMDVANKTHFRLPPNIILLGQHVSDKSHDTKSIEYKSRKNSWKNSVKTERTPSELCLTNKLCSTSETLQLQNKTVCYLNREKC